MLYNQYTPASQWLYKATGAVTRCQIPERCDYNWKKLKRNQANNQREKNQKADVPEFYTTWWNFAKLWVREQRKLSEILLSFGYGEYRQAFGHCTRREKAICNSRKSTLNGFWKAVCYRGYSPRGRADPKQHTERHPLHCATHDWPEGANVTIFLSSTYHMERLESPQSALKNVGDFLFPKRISQHVQMTVCGNSVGLSEILRIWWSWNQCYQMLSISLKFDLILTNHGVLRMFENYFSNDI